MQGDMTQEQAACSTLTVPTALPAGTLYVRALSLKLSHSSALSGQPAAFKGEALASVHQQCIVHQQCTVTGRLSEGRHFFERNVMIIG